MQTNHGQSNQVTIQRRQRPQISNQRPQPGHVVIISGQGFQNWDGSWGYLYINGKQADYQVQGSKRFYLTRFLL